MRPLPPTARATPTEWVTPFVLARIEQETGGACVPANLALAENNAAPAAEVAQALCRVR